MLKERLRGLYKDSHGKWSLIVLSHNSTYVLKECGLGVSINT